MNHYSYRSLLLHHKEKNYLKEALFIVSLSIMMMLISLFSVWIWDNSKTESCYVEGIVTENQMNVQLEQTAE